MVVFIVEPIHPASDADIMSELLAREGFTTFRRDKEEPGGTKAYAFLAMASTKRSVNLLEAIAVLKLNSGVFSYRRLQTIHTPKQVACH